MLTLFNKVVTKNGGCFKIEITIIALLSFFKKLCNVTLALNDFCRTCSFELNKRLLVIWFFN